MKPKEFRESVFLLGARTLLGAPGIATRSKKLLGIKASSYTLQGTMDRVYVELIHVLL